MIFKRFKDFVFQRLVEKAVVAEVRPICGNRRSLTYWKRENSSSKDCNIRNNRARQLRFQIFHFGFQIILIWNLEFEIWNQQKYKEAREGQTVDALASGGDEGRDKLR